MTCSHAATYTIVVSSKGAWRGENAMMELARNAVKMVGRPTHADEE